MSTLITIGNSQGIRIPKPMIKQADLENKELELIVLDNGLLIKPIPKQDRSVWKENIENIMAAQNHRDEGLLEEFLNDSDLEDTVW